MLFTMPDGQLSHPSDDVTGATDAVGGYDVIGRSTRATGARIPG